MELDKKTVSENDILHKGTWTYLIQWKKKFYPKINKFYPNDEQSIFLLELNRLSKNSEG